MHLTWGLLLHTGCRLSLMLGSCIQDVMRCSGKESFCCGEVACCQTQWQAVTIVLLLFF